MIILNSVFLGLVDYTDLGADTIGNKLAAYSEPVFTAIFTAEAVIKIIAQGFIFDRGCYLRDAWNWLDFFVVITALLNYLPNVTSVSGLRTFRLFRPLRSLSAFPSMRTLVNTLLTSVI